MGLKKRGKKYYSVYCAPDKKETWIALDATSKREAQKKHERIMSVFKRERTTCQITNAILEFAKHLANNNLNVDESAGYAIGIENIAMREAMKIIDDIIPAPVLTVQDIWRRYNASKPELKKSTARTKEQRFNKFATWFGDRDVRSLTENHCRKFLKSLGTNKSQTVNNYISVLSSVWSASIEINNPWGKHLRQKSNVERKKAFARSQVKAIVEYCNEKNEEFWSNAVTIGYYTGLRFIDIVHLSWTSIQGDYIDLKPFKTERTGNRVRIKIHPKLQSKLKLIRKSNNLYLFPDQVKQYNVDNGKLSEHFMTILKACEIKQYGGDGWGFHSLRHTFITEAKDAGIRIEDIQAVVGHIDEKTTEGYYHGITDADLSRFPALSIA